MAASSAPGTLFLFGEHAVVYGEPAIPCAIDRRTTVTANQRSDNDIRIDAPALRFDEVTIKYNDGPPTVDIPTGRVRRAIRYVDTAIDHAQAITDSAAGLDITVESDIPIGAGLGSSAAVTVATLDAAVRAYGGAMASTDLAERAYRVESEAQDGEASRAQTYCATMGGAVRIEGEEHEPVTAPELPFVVGYDGGGTDTGDIVAEVRALREKHSFIADTVTAIGDLVRNGETVLATGDTDTLGQLMDINHGLLTALGVSSRSLDALAWTARDAGALGAKLTGAGRGGCIVALDPTDATESALSMSPDCVTAFRANLAATGVNRE